MSSFNFDESFVIREAENVLTKYGNDNFIEKQVHIKEINKLKAKNKKLRKANIILKVIVALCSIVLFTLVI